MYVCVYVCFKRCVLAIFHSACVDTLHFAPTQSAASIFHLPVTPFICLLMPCALSLGLSGIAGITFSNDFEDISTAKIQVTRYALIVFVLWVGSGVGKLHPVLIYISHIFISKYTNTYTHMYYRWKSSISAI